MNGQSVELDPSSAVWLRRFALSAGLILGLTGLAKLWTAFGDVKLLTVVDPIVGIQFKYLMLAVGGGRPQRRSRMED